MFRVDGIEGIEGEAVARGMDPRREDGVADAGAEAAARIGEVISVQVISRPHDELPSFVQQDKKAQKASK